MNETGTYELTLTKVVRAPREKVFEAWTSPEWLTRWYGMADDWTVPVAEVDLRVGGRYRIVMAGPGFDAFDETGEFLEIVPNERLVYTMTSGAWTEQLLVTVTFAEHPDGTEVTLTDAGYATADLRDQHANGWPGWLDRLAGQFE
ncbi:MAG: SRPBCC domain-containing protein [Acidimicrobiia bacterium]